MQTGKSIINLPLIICIALSVAVHVMALYGRGFEVPAKIELDQGRTVVQLTLIPSIASQAAEPEPEPVEEPMKEVVSEPEPAPPKPAEPIPAPIPEPVVKPKPITEPVTEPVSEPKSLTESIPEPSQPEPTINPDLEKAVTDSAEQHSTLITEKGVAVEAVSTRPIQAKYPRISRRRNEEGNVELTIEVLASGKPGKIIVTKSSGYKRLDEAAMKAVEKATFIPARKFGQPVNSKLKRTIIFKLFDE